MGGVGELTLWMRLPMPFLKTDPPAALLIPPGDGKPAPGRSWSTTARTSARSSRWAGWSAAATWAGGRPCPRGTRSARPRWPGSRSTPSGSSWPGSTARG